MLQFLADHIDGLLGLGFWGKAAMAFVAVHISMAAVTLYLHRDQAHRAIDLHPAIRHFFRLWIWLTSGMVTREWVAVHRKHHAFTDEDGDPHSPVRLGWVKVQTGNVGLYRRVATDPAQVERYARDLPADRWDRALFDKGWLGLLVGIALLCVAFGPWVGLLAAGIHTVLYLQLNAAVNAVTHTFGRRPWPNTATNLRWLALLTSGEGMHNNHHAVPTSARLSFRRGDVDPSWRAIALFRRLGWATVRSATDDRLALAEAGAARAAAEAELLEAVEREPAAV